MKWALEYVEAPYSFPVSVRQMRELETARTLHSRNYGPEEVQGREIGWTKDASRALYRLRTGDGYHIFAASVVRLQRGIYQMGKSVVGSAIER